MGNVFDIQIGAINQTLNSCYGVKVLEANIDSKYEKLYENLYKIRMEYKYDSRYGKGAYAIKRKNDDRKEILKVILHD